MRNTFLFLTLFFMTSSFEKASCTDLIKRSLSDVEFAESERPACKTSRTDISEFELASSESLADLTSNVSRLDFVEKTVSYDTLETYMSNVYNQIEQISVARLKSYGFNKIKKTLLDKMYASHEHAYFLLTIFRAGFQNYFWDKDYTDDFSHEHREFFIQLNQKANKGDCHAAFNLAYAYFYGICLELDIPSAKMFYEKAAALGHDIALGCVLDICKYGVPSTVTIKGKPLEILYGKDEGQYNKWLEFSKRVVKLHLPIAPIE